MLSEPEIVKWIAAVRAALPASSADYIEYVSLHGAQRGRVGGAAERRARWAPKLVSPADINGKGMVYRFDIREYWRHNKGVNVMAFGGSDDDMTWNLPNVSAEQRATPADRRRSASVLRRDGEDPRRDDPRSEQELHVEPIAWAFEWAQAHHGYSDTTSN